MAIRLGGTGDWQLADKPIIVFPEKHRHLLELRLPDTVELRTFRDLDEAMEIAPQAEIGWFEEFKEGLMFKASAAAENAKWINSSGVGIDAFRTDLMEQRGQIFTNGVGLRSDTIADFAVMGVLNISRRFAAIVRAHDRKEWTSVPPGSRALSGSHALIIGYGSIGRAIGDRLSAFGVEITGVRRTPGSDPREIGPDDWRARLGEFDWIVIAAPGTAETEHMLGAAEFAAMKQGAGIVNIARGSLIDQAALIAALESGQLDGAVLDPTTPEPLPEGDPLWDAPNVIITSHVAGAGQNDSIYRAVDRFLENLDRYLKGEPLEYVVGFDRGY